MLDHERRSYAPSPPPPERTGQKPRRRRKRLDVPRPDAAVRVPLPSPGAMVTEIEEPEEVDAIDFLSVEGRRDVLAGSAAGFGGGRL